MTKPYLSVVIPAYNEAKNFNRGKLGEVLEYLKKQGYTFELLLVDDGSSDETPSLLDTFARNKEHVTVIKNPHQGKALTVATGMMVAKGENRLYADFDQSTPITEVARLLEKRNDGYDIAIGSREVQGAQRESEP
jgi:dolichyl-phosphate beta-glucosyltransferase